MHHDLHPKRSNLLLVAVWVAAGCGFLAVWSWLKSPGDEHRHENDRSFRACDDCLSKTSNFIHTSAQKPPASFAAYTVPRSAITENGIRLVFRDAQSNEQITSGTLFLRARGGEERRIDYRNQNCLTLPSSINSIEHAKFKSPGYLDKQITIEKSSATEQVVFLERAAGIWGQVVLPSGRPVIANVTVVAWPSTHNLQPKDVLRSDSQLHTNGVRFSRTDVHGQFAIRHNNEGPMRIAAVGQGFLSPETQLVESDDQVELTVFYAYGAELRLEADGPLETNNGLYFERNGTRWVYSGKEREYQGPRALLAWLGEEWRTTLRSESRANSQSLHVYLAREDVHSAGPIKGFAHVPGYAQAAFEFYLPRALSELPLHIVNLTATTDSWSDLLVQVQRPFFQATSATGERPNRGAILFEAVDQPELPGYRYLLPNLQGGDYLISQIPSARYKLRFQAENKFAFWPPVEEEPVLVDLSEDIRTEIQVNLTNLGWATLRFLDKETQTDHLGSYYLHIRSQEKNGQLLQPFFRNPLQLDGLPAGDYEVWAARSPIQLHRLRNSGAPPIRIGIVAGHETKQEIVIEN